ncbi:MAG: flagellar motor protein MotA [Phycisphaerae bacterium]|jgi:biopolymer transport protein ExbB|nr:flagellar motor protein MotA [Phycisphaerae bacterium]|tara:strand:- start:911 stop:1537 length:627 start_codon:yes stop_codon:yes gene_type:complete
MEHVLNTIEMLLDQGGYVMIPLLILSICSVALIIERVCFWVALSGRSHLERLAGLNEALREGDAPRIRGMVEGDRSPYGKVVLRLVEDGSSDAVAMQAVDSVRSGLDRYMVVLSTIITAAPLLGILGTVIGIIQSFQLLGSQSTLTDPREVAGGIAAALITTAFGLIVALVTLFPYMIFRAQSAHAIGRLETLIASAQIGLPKKRSGK